MERPASVDTVRDDEIDLRDLILPLIENWHRIVAAVIAAAVLAGAASFLVAPTYESEIRLRIVQLTGFSNIGWTDPPATSYEGLAQAPGLKAAVAEQVGGEIEDPLSWFDDAVDVTVDPGAGVITITTRADSPERARDIARIVAAELIARSQASNVEVLRQAIGAEIARLEDLAQAVEQQLARTEPRIWVQEALTDEVGRLSLLLQQQGASAGDVARALEETGAVVLVRQAVNPVWEALTQQLADLRSRRDYLAQQLDRLNAADAEQAYSSLVQLHDATLPRDPVSPRKLLNVVVGGMLGGMLAVFWVFFRRMWTSIVAPEAVAPGTKHAAPHR